MKKRVKIPHQDPKALLELATQMRNKHVADGDASPLKVLNWTDVNTLIDSAIEIEDRALQLKREKLLTYQQRSRQLIALTNVVRSSRDILTGVHAVEMKTLGLWGFDVLENRVTSLEPDEAKRDKVSR